MKKTVVILILAVLSAGLFASSLSATADCGFIQDLLIRTNSYQFSADIRYSFAEKYELRLPLTLSVGEDAKFADAGIFLNYYPLKNKGLFMGLSLFQVAMALEAEGLDKTTYAMNEICIGWTFKIGKGLLIEPSVSIRDSTGTFEDEFELIKGILPCYRKFRPRLSVGWNFQF